MTHEPEKNVFLDARRQLKVIGETLDLLRGGGSTIPHMSENALNNGYAALDALEMSIGEIVDWGTEYAATERARIVVHPANQYKIDLITKELEMSKSFFEGTERAALEQERADAEKKYGSSNRKEHESHN
jgi:hypothetical protein